MSPSRQLRLLLDGTFHSSVMTWSAVSTVFIFSSIREYLRQGIMQVKQKDCFKAFYVSDTDMLYQYKYQGMGLFRESEGVMRCGNSPPSVLTGGLTQDLLFKVAEECDITEHFLWC